MEQEYSNRIPELIDPLTGEVRKAGSFSNAEWKRIVRDNPDAATLILQLRRKEDEIDELSNVADNAVGTGIGAVSAGVAFPLLSSVAPEAAQQLAMGWRDRSWAAPGPVGADNIYKGKRVTLGINPNRVVELRVDGNTNVGSERMGRQDLKQIGSEVNDAKQQLLGFLAEPSNKRLYVAAPEDSDGLQGARMKRFEEAGFNPVEIGGKTVFVKDNRIGADLLGRGYHLIDDLAYRQLSEKALGRTDNVLKAARFAGALSAALGIGGLIGTGINFVNERI